MAAHDHQVLVVLVTRLVAQVVAAGHHHAARAEGVDHDDLVVDHRVAQLVELFFPIAELVRHAGHARHQHVGCVGHAALGQEGRELAQRCISGEGAPHVERLARRLPLFGAQAHRLQKARRARVEGQEQHALLRRGDQVEHLREVRRRDLRVLGAAHGVGREPDRHAGRRYPRLDRAGAAPVAHGLALGRRGGRVLQQQVAVVLEARGHRFVVDQQGVVGLRAQAGGGPVGAAGHDRARLAALVGPEHELAVPDRAGAQKAVGDRHAAGMQIGAGGGIGAVLDLARVGLAVGADVLLAAVGVGQAQVESLPGGQRLDRRHQLGVGQFVERQLTMAARAPGRLLEQRQQSLVQHVARQRIAHRAAGPRDFAAQRLGRVGVEVLLDQFAQLARDRLGGDQADVEVGLDRAIVALDVHLVGQQLDGGMRRQRLGVGAHHRHDLVAVRAGRGKHVFPLERLHRPDVGVLHRVRLARHARREAHVGRQRHAGGVARDAPYRETQATGDPGVQPPPEVGDVVVGDRKRLTSSHGSLR